MAFTTDPVFIAAVLCFNVLLSELLVQRTFCRLLGTALIVIVVTAVTANLGLIPAGGSLLADSQPNWVYKGINGYVIDLAIFWLLLRVNLRDVLKAGLPMIALFLLGCVATTLGVFVGMWVVGGQAAFGDDYGALGGMFVGTYTGGSANFNAVALAYEVPDQRPLLYSGAMAVDSIMTTIWMVATVALPRLLGGFWPGRRRMGHTDASDAAGDVALTHDTETVSPIDLSLLLGAGLGVIWLSDGLSLVLESRSISIPPILIVTTIALLLAQVPFVNRLKGTRLLGMFAVYLFLAVVGAYCDLSALGGLGELAPKLTLFVAIVVVVHGLVIFAVGAASRADVDMVAVASQANIGGGTTALALARSIGRNDLVLPAILVGSLGTALGTYLGFATVKLLQ